MADEDEIDILGDYNLDSVFTKNDSNIYENGMLVSQNSDLLNCDYTIHPQWLLDKPSANPENWYNSGTPQVENDAIEQVSTDNCITDESGWTEKEKNLLESGIAIFGKSNVRLAQFVGSKTASEVKYYLKNFYMENHLNRQPSAEEFMEEIGDMNLASGDIVNASQIPASIEEVIAVVSTAKPTVQTNNKPQKQTVFGQSKNFNTVYGTLENESMLESKVIKGQSRKVNLVRQTPGKRGRPKKKRKIIKFKVKAKSKDNPIKVKSVVKGKSRREKNGVNIVESTVTSLMEHVRQTSEGEQIVKIEKVDDESEDIEVNIETSDDNCDDEEPLKIVQNTTQCDKETISDSENEIVLTHNQTKTALDLSPFGEIVSDQLTSLATPTSEVKIDKDDISDLEKAVLFEYFDGKSQNKTPQRYLTIRNYIVNAWESSKPNYLFKTPLRTGLKHCGDVNCIGKIHYFLEQIGAINFGCEQVSFVRPLTHIIQEPVAKDKTKRRKNDLPREIGKLGPRSRIRRKFTNDGEGGCTLAHDDEGHVINKTIVNEDSVVKQRMYIRKPTVRLIYCRPFNDEKPQEYTVKVHLTALLAMDFHAHTCLSEVMGLIAGHWSPRDKILTVLHYEPCKNVVSSATHCDMCPISQAKAADVIHSKGLDILGWFHSHPTFAPEPSQQDLDTQRSVQRWIGRSRPCVGVILSPFSANGALIASPFRCLMVERHAELPDRCVPYRFEVDVVDGGFSARELVEAVAGIWREGGGGRVDFRKGYFLDASMTHLDKFISSLQMHMAKCGTIDKTTCDAAILGVTEILNK